MDSIGEKSFMEQSVPKSTVKQIKTCSVPLLKRSSYTSTGISNDCQHLYYYNEKKISVFRIEDMSAQSYSFRSVFDKGRELTNGEPIFDACMSSRFLVIATNARLLTIDIASHCHFEPIAHDGWEPDGVACFEDGGYFVLAVGCGQGHSSSNSRGVVEIYNYQIGSRTQRLVHCNSLTLPIYDRPKKVTIGADPRIVTCVTRIQNKIFLWDLDETFSQLNEPFNFLKNRSRVENYPTGITSICQYMSSTGNHYLLCTTSPSRERRPNQGEWSFILPVPRPETPISPRLRPPSSTIHCFDQFKNHRALRAGAVSSEHNVFAVLEDSGRISILPLVASPHGGVCGSAGRLQILDKEVGSVSGCLKFTPDGKKLIAVDAKGKVVIAEFEGQRSIE